MKISFSICISSFVIMLCAQAFAGEQTCIARKSIAWMDSNDQFQIRKAETASFKVVAAEHEDPYVLELKEKDGKAWDSVEVMTGTVAGTPDGEIFQVIVNVKNEKNEVMTRLALIGAKDSKLARAITTIELADTDLDPSLTVECRLNP